MGHQGQGRRAAGVPAPRRSVPRRRDGLLPRQRHRHASLLDDVARFLDLGYKAVRAQAAVPNIGGSYGVRKGKIYEPAATSLPDEQPWSTEAYLDFAPTYLEAVRDRFGFGFHLLHDVHHRLTPNEAAQFGKRVEPYRLFWMEDPDPRREPGGVPAHPPAHHHPDRGRRGAQLDLGLSSS